MSQPRRIAARISIPAEKAREWFCDALRNDDAKPSLAICEKLVQEFSTILNRQNNEELERDPGLPLWLARDVSQEEEAEKRKAKLRSAANQFFVAVEEYESYFGYDDRRANEWPFLGEIQQLLLKMGAAPIPSDSSAAPGRPREAWHGAARLIAPKIKDALEGAGYRGRLSIVDEESAVAYVGAATINWAYGINIKTGGFAAAMEKRHRRGGKRVKAPTLEEMFPETHFLKEE